MGILESVFGLVSKSRLDVALVNVEHAEESRSNMLGLYLKASNDEHELRNIIKPLRQECNVLAVQANNLRGQIDTMSRENSSLGDKLMAQDQELRRVREQLAEESRKRIDMAREVEQQQKDAAVARRHSYLSAFDYLKSVGATGSLSPATSALSKLAKNYSKDRGYDVIKVPSLTNAVPINGFHINVLRACVSSDLFALHRKDIGIDVAKASDLQGNDEAQYSTVSEFISSNRVGDWSAAGLSQRASRVARMRGIKLPFIAGTRLGVKSYPVSLLREITGVNNKPA